MARRPLIIGAAILAFTSLTGVRAQEQQHPAPDITASFKGGVDMVRIAAVVRDQKGRFVQDLKVKDFEVLDGGQSRNISDFRTDIAGISVAVLFDVSGSMEGQLPNAREAASHVLSWMDTTRDEAAVYTFDTHLDERTPFTTGLRELPETVRTVVPFGATSLHDAIAATARRVGEREGRRRAVVVLTDGADNWSKLKPNEVSALASGIDVPVYIFGIAPSIDNPSEQASTNRVWFGLAGPLADLAAGPAVMCSWRARRDSAASRRGRSSTSCGINTSLHLNRAAGRAGIRSWSERGTRT